MLVLRRNTVRGSAEADEVIVEQMMMLVMVVVVDTVIYGMKQPRFHIGVRRVTNRCNTSNHVTSQYFSFAGEKILQATHLNTVCSCMHVPDSIVFTAYSRISF
jgi:hypothetical protein